LKFQQTQSKDCGQSTCERGLRLLYLTNFTVWFTVFKRASLLHNPILGLQSLTKTLTPYMWMKSGFTKLRLLEKSSWLKMK
jgi:hypothetical protein